MAGQESDDRGRSGPITRLASFKDTIWRGNPQSTGFVNKNKRYSLSNRCIIGILKTWYDITVGGFSFWPVFFFLYRLIFYTRNLMTAPRCIYCHGCVVTRFFQSFLQLEGLFTILKTVLCKKFTSFIFNVHLFILFFCKTKLTFRIVSCEQYYLSFFNFIFLININESVDMYVYKIKMYLYCLHVVKL